MQEMIVTLQDACLNLTWTTLFVPGIIAAATGLFLWLGGMRYSSLVLTLIGAAAGASLGLMASQWFSLQPAIPALIGAIGLGLIALLLQQTVILVLAACICATVGGATYLSYNMTTPQQQELVGQLRNSVAAPSELADQDSPSGSYIRRLRELAATRDSEGASLHDKAIARLKELLAEIELSASSNRGTLILWIVLGAGIGLILAFVLKKIVMALCCSIVGTTAVLLGVSAMLLSKQTPVLTGFASQPRLLPILFLSMVAFGWLVQLLLARPSKAAAEDSEEEE